MKHKVWKKKMMIQFILNLPWTCIGVIAGIISFPESVPQFRKNPHTIVVKVKSFWWWSWFHKGVRAMTIGQCILLGPSTESFDREHELTHVEQYQRFPFIFPFLYYLEFFKNGYRNNKYEKEAYEKAGNIYKL